MSASLVGSEMCIRDRAMTAAMGPRTLAHLDAPFKRLRTTCQHSITSRLSCLLYTSDAADDM
eukprot:671945-Alexandrium_andersonii.AAC.1